MPYRFARKLANIINRTTNIAHALLKPFVSEEKLLEWKPIHLCWWFDKHGIEKPKYFIGKTWTPTMTTQACTNVEATQVDGNGTKTGGSDATRRGFCYIQGNSGDPTTSDSVEYEDGTFGDEAYSLTITGLTAATDYRVRAYGTNSNGTGYGATVDVTTTAIPEEEKDNSAKANIVATTEQDNSATAFLGDKVYTREATTLPATAADLTTVFSASEMTDVASDDATRVSLEGSGSLIHMFKERNSNNTDSIVVSWDGQVDTAPSDSTVYLQIYNFNTPAWEQLDSDSTTGADTDFTLEGTQSTSLSNYYTTYNSQYWVAIRVYQTN